MLVVGAGNSGADIALELAATRATWLSGTPSAVVPFRVETWFGRHVGVRFVYLPVAIFVQNHQVTLPQVIHFRYRLITTAPRHARRLEEARIIVIVAEFLPGQVYHFYERARI